MFNLLTRGFVELESSETKKLRPSALFHQAVRIQDWTSLPVPDTAAALNSAKIDELGRLAGVRTLIVLKNAAVVGDVFSSEQLSHMIPSHEQALHESLLRILSDVESKFELIELVDQLRDGSVLRACDAVH